MASKLVGRVVIAGAGVAAVSAYSGIEKVAATAAKITSIVGSRLASIAQPVGQVPAATTVEALSQSVNLLRIAMQSLPWMTAAGCLVAIRKYFYDSGRVEHISDTVEGHTIKLEEIAEQIDFVKGTSLSIKLDLATVDTKVTTIETNLSSAIVEIGKIDADIAEARDDSKADHSELKSDIQHLAIKVDGIDDKLETAITRLDQGMIRVEQRIVTSDEKLDALLRTMSALTSALGVPVPQAERESNSSHAHTVRDQGPGLTDKHNSFGDTVSNRQPVAV